MGSDEPRKKIAIVGAGMSGLAAYWALRNSRTSRHGCAWTVLLDRREYCTLQSGRLPYVSFTRSFRRTKTVLLLIDTYLIQQIYQGF
jgi:flavin-dependent dehydrogenase